MIDAPQRPAQPARLALLQQLITACRNWLTAPAGRSRWLVLCCLALAALAFVSHPGHIISDTKLDLAVNPAGFLARALQLWDPSQFGQLQDQAVGYIFPVGPLFLLVKAAAVPAWVAQRIWIALMLLAAFLGIVRLADRLGIGTPATRIAAGFGYALAPNALGMLGTLSSEFLPIAMLPWILIPLVRAAAAGPAARTAGRLTAAAQSAVAVALCSGINAAATCAVLIPPVIFLLTVPRPAPRWRIIAWWAPAVAARHVLVDVPAAAAAEVRRVDTAVYRERGPHHGADWPFQYAARHGELDHLPGGRRQTVGAGRLPDIDRGACPPS